MHYYRNSRRNVTRGNREVKRRAKEVEEGREHVRRSTLERRKQSLRSRGSCRHARNGSLRGIEKIRSQRNRTDERPSIPSHGEWSKRRVAWTIPWRSNDFVKVASTAGPISRLLKALFHPIVPGWNKRRPRHLLAASNYSPFSVTGPKVEHLRNACSLGALSRSAWERKRKL